MHRIRTRGPAGLLIAFLAVAPARAQELPPRVVERIDSIFAEWDREDSPGAAVAVLKDGEIVLERGYGSAQLEYGIPITPQTVFHVASVSKQFTTFAVALLAQRGELSLDDEVRKHLPELPDFGRPVTVRQLVHHTSGIRDQWELLATAGWRLDDVITKDQILRTMWRQRELNFEPGSDHLYSNMGYTLLAEIVARVSGQPFPEFVEENIYRPLGMNSSHMHDDHEHVVPNRAYSYKPDPDGGWKNAVLSYANAGATSMFTTAGDLGRWLHNFETGRVGGPALVEQMRERAVLLGRDTIDYAFAIVRGEHAGRETWSHSGGDAGFRSHVLHFPGERLGVVVLSNLATFNPVARTHDVADAVLGIEPAVAAAAENRPEPRRVNVSSSVLERYEGRYDIQGVGIVRVIREGRELTVRVGEDRIPLVATSDSTFRADAVSAEIRFVRDGRETKGVIVDVEGDRMEGVRVAAPELGPAQLAAYAGDYYSPELMTIYRLRVQGDSLVARHPRHGDLALTPVDEDTFNGGAWFFNKLEFTRSGPTAVDGFRLTGGRVRNLRFIRLQEGALPDRGNP